MNTEEVKKKKLNEAMCTVFRAKQKQPVSLCWLARVFYNHARTWTWPMVGLRARII